MYIRSAVESLVFIATVVGWWLGSGEGSIVERKVQTAREGVCKRQAREKGTNHSTEIHPPPVMVSEFHGFSPGTF